MQAPQVSTAAHGATPSLIAMEGVSVRFGAVLALRGVDLQARAGEVVLLAGPNGAGKSTLLGVLLGLVRPDAGTLRWKGRATTANAEFRTHLGYMPEAVAFAGNASGRDVLTFFARARGVDTKRVPAVLAEVGLADAANRSVRGYSRGMRQRLGLAVAIVHEPELLVLDEPTGGLDQEGLSLLWRIFDRWRDAGRTIWVASHELGLVERRVDRVAVIRAGRLLAEGSPHALREQVGLRVKTTWTLRNDGDDADSARQAAALAARLLQTDGIDAQNAVRPVDRAAGECKARVVVELPPDGLAAAMQLASAWAHEGDGGLDGVRVEEPGLDQVYETLLAQAAQAEGVGAAVGGAGLAGAGAANVGVQR
jgi:Cu-processing system ATP-binding protein